MSGSVKHDQKFFSGIYIIQGISKKISVAMTNFTGEDNR